jgi:hypothetical protein
MGLTVPQGERVAQWRAAATSDVGFALLQVFLGELEAVLGGLDRIGEREAVAGQVLGSAFLDLLETLEHLRFRRRHRPDALLDGDSALQRVVGDDIDGLDDFRVLLERVMDQRRTARFFLLDHLFQQVQTLLRELQVELEPKVRFLDQPHLIGFIGGQEVPLRGERRGGHHHDQTGPFPHRNSFTCACP